MIDIAIVGYEGEVTADVLRNTVCYGDNCALKFDCERFLNLSEEHKFFIISPPYEMVEDMCTCDYYLEV